MRSQSNLFSSLFAEDERSTLRLDHRSLTFAFTDRSLAFASAAGNAQANNGGADEDQDFFHDAPQLVSSTASLINANKLES